MRASSSGSTFSKAACALSSARSRRLRSFASAASLFAALRLSLALRFLIGQRRGLRLLTVVLLPCCIARGVLAALGGFDLAGRFSRSRSVGTSDSSSNGPICADGTFEHDALRPRLPWQSHDGKDCCSHPRLRARLHRRHGYREVLKPL